MLAWYTALPVQWPTCGSSICTEPILSRYHQLFPPQSSIAIQHNNKHNICCACYICAGNILSPAADTSFPILMMLLWYSKCLLGRHFSSVKLFTGLYTIRIILDTPSSRCKIFQQQNQLSKRGRSREYYK